MLQLQGPVQGEFGMFGVIAGLLLCALASAELFVRSVPQSGFAVRKLLQLGGGVLAFFLPVLFDSNFFPVLLAVIFLFVALFGRLSGGLHVLCRQGPQERILPGYGPLLVPLVFLVQALLLWDEAPWIIRLSMLATGGGDVAAAFVGVLSGGCHIERLTRNPKTVEGSLGMLVTSFGFMAGLLLFFRPHFQGELAASAVWELVALALLLAVIATAVEAILSYGLDNFFVPLSVAYVLYVLSFSPSIDIGDFLLGGVFALLLSVVSLLVKFLDASGATATFLLGTTIFGIGGVDWTVPLLTFYLLSSILSKLGHTRKARFDLVFEKGSQRDAGQVCANGGIAWLIMIAYSLTGDQAFFFAYLGTLAAVQSDTWATEIGTMWPNPTARLITTMKEVPVGTSGGVSVPGTLGAFGGALLICASALAIGVEWVYDFGILRSFLLIGFSGLLASLVDSFFGATIQAQYYDPVRKKVTERTSSLKKDGTVVKNKLIKGYHIVNNDLVNTMCAVSGSFLAYVFSSFF
ncbi:MAG: DUF92 domain-containing protein [Prosthecochloris sp.]|nr:DUF92 domain-containing protein [Prosthecochloris sp.]